MDQHSLLWIFVSAALINNFTLTYFLGLCPFFGVSKKLSTSLQLGLANIFVLVITSLATQFLNHFVLPYAGYLTLISYIVVIASTVQFVEMVIKKVSEPLYKALGIFLPLITTNCAILFLAFEQTKRGLGVIEGVVFAIGAGVGLTLALVLMAGMREECEFATVPKIIRGAALSFFIAGILSMAFMGFAGLFSAH